MTANKQQLRERAESVMHWSSSLTAAWPSDPDFNDVWAVGAIDEDGNRYPVIEVDAADQYDAPGDSERLARFFTTANPATVLTLLDDVETLQAEREKLAEALETLLEVRVVEADVSYGLAYAKAEHALAAHRKGAES